MEQNGQQTYLGKEMETNVEIGSYMSCEGLLMADLHERSLHSGARIEVGKRGWKLQVMPKDS